MKSWYEIYRDRMTQSYVNHVAMKYAPFIETLYDVDAEIATEIGCGAGNITRILREMQGSGKFYHLTDSCPQMLGLAVENNPMPNCLFSCSDALRHVPSDCSLIHSHGLLEHFHDEQIQEIVRIMKYGAPIQIHYVPGIKYKIPSRGDERLLEPDQWEDILKRLGRVSVSTFNDDHDIILRIER